MLPKSSERKFCSSQHRAVARSSGSLRSTGEPVRGGAAHKGWLGGRGGQPGSPGLPSGSSRERSQAINENEAIRLSGGSVNENFLSREEMGLRSYQNDGVRSSSRAVLETSSTSKGKVETRGTF